MTHDLTATSGETIVDADALVDAVNPQDSDVVNWLIALGLVVGGILVAAAARRVIGRLFRRSSANTDHAENLISRIIQALIMLVVLVYALGAVGVRITPLLGALGIGGIALALALQPALLNLFSGMIIHAQRPLRVGEEIRTGDVQGRVLDVTSRAVVIRTYAGETVYIPNSVVVDREIVNFVRHGHRRSTVRVAVAYGTDLAKARQVIQDAARTAEGVLSSPEVQVFAADFAESGIDFDVDIWHGPGEQTRRQTRDRAVHAIHEALRAADVTIPFPQRTLWFGSEQARGGEPSSADGGA
jgi:small-conductance mechanosensitive channel